MSAQAMMPSIGRPKRPIALFLSFFCGCWCQSALQAETVDADLDGLRRSLDAGSSAARSLEDDATALFLSLADVEDDWLTTHGEAVAGIRLVVQRASRVAADKKALARFVSSNDPKVPVSPDDLRDAHATYRRAADHLSLSTSDVGNRIAAIAARPDITDPAIRWPAFIDATERYLDDVDRTSTAVKSLDRLLSFQGRRLALIKFNLYEYVDSRHGPNTAYGLYTHVLFHEANGSRNRAFLEALRTSTLKAGEVPADEAALINLFVLPVKSRLRARIADEAGANQGDIAEAVNYDHDTAATLLRKACLNGDIRVSDFCAASGGGPFLLAHETWLPDGDRITPPLLVVDLSTVHEAAFGEFIRAVKEQVMLSDFSAGERLVTLRLQLLTIVLDVADWLAPIRKSIAEIVSLGGKK